MLAQMMDRETGSTVALLRGEHDCLRRCHDDNDDLDDFEVSLETNIIHD